MTVFEFHRKFSTYFRKMQDLWEKNINFKSNFKSTGSKGNTKQPVLNP